MLWSGDIAQAASARARCLLLRIGRTSRRGPRLHSGDESRAFFYWAGDKVLVEKDGDREFPAPDNT